MDSPNDQTPRKLYRSTTDRIFAGVCGGLGEYFNIDPLLFRGLFLLMFIGAGSGFFLYLLLMVIIPKAPAGIAPGAAADGRERLSDLVYEMRDGVQRVAGQARQWEREGGDHRIFIGGIIIVLGVLLLLNQVFPQHWFRWDLFWPVAIMIIGLLVIARR